MKENLSIKRKDLRKMSLWKKKEPTQITKDEINEVKTVFKEWNPTKMSESWLSEIIKIKPSILTEDQKRELKQLVGPENIKFDASSRILFSHDQCAESIVRMRLGNFLPLAEAVVMPRNEEEIVGVLQFASKNNINVIPITGRTGVTRAIQFEKPGIALSLRPHLTKIINVNNDNLTVTAQAGVLGPELDDVIIPKGLSLGHYPQSFEESGIGGWIAGRSAGQNSTLYGKIENLVLSMRIATAEGIFESKLTPAAADGPNWLPLYIGSEGTLGVITQATLKLHHDYPKNRIFESFLFKTFNDGIAALKEINQMEFKPAIARLSDGEETELYIRLDKVEKIPSIKDKIIERFLKFKNLLPLKRSILLLVFEGTEEYTKMSHKKMKQVAKKHGGFKSGSKYTRKWFNDRFAHPHIRDTLLDVGIIIDTLETATTWDNLQNLYINVRSVLKEAGCPIVTAHISHSYPHGACIYFIYIKPITSGTEIKDIRNLQNKAITAFIANNGVISHHHGVGKAFSKIAYEQWPKQIIKATKLFKKGLDPSDTLNAGNFPFNLKNSENS